MWSDYIVGHLFFSYAISVRTAAECSIFVIHVDFALILCLLQCPVKIKQYTHRHALHHLNGIRKHYNACGSNPGRSFFECELCDYHIHIRCAWNLGTVMHTWDEHQLHSMHPPVKDHPQDFDFDLCSGDINPNYWFYHCRECDTSLYFLPWLGSIFKYQVGGHCESWFAPTHPWIHQK